MTEKKKDIKIIKGATDILLLAPHGGATVKLGKLGSAQRRTPPI